jgi:hypothetical protein
MRKIGGLLAAVLFSVSLAGSPAMAFNKKVANKEFKGKIMAEAPEAFNVFSKAKGVKELKFLKSAKRAFTKQAFVNKQFATKAFDGKFERSSINSHVKQGKNDFLC